MVSTPGLHLIDLTQVASELSTHEGNRTRTGTPRDSVIRWFKKRAESVYRYNTVLLSPFSHKATVCILEVNTTLSSALGVSQCKCELLSKTMNLSLVSLEVGASRLLQPLPQATCFIKKDRF